MRTPRGAIQLCKINACFPRRIYTGKRCWRNNNAKRERLIKIYLTAPNVERLLREKFPLLFISTFFIHHAQKPIRQFIYELQNNHYSKTPI